MLSCVRADQAVTCGNRNGDSAGNCAEFLRMNCPAFRTSRFVGLYIHTLHKSFGLFTSSSTPWSSASCCADIVCVIMCRGGWGEGEVEGGGAQRGDDMDVCVPARTCERG